MHYQFRVLGNALCCVKKWIFVAQLGVRAYANILKLYHQSITILSAAVSVYYIFYDLCVLILMYILSDM